MNFSLLLGTAYTDRLTKTDLLTRGWTESVIGKWLGPPDVRVRVFGADGEAFFYDAIRVQRIEQGPKWKLWKKTPSEKRLVEGQRANMGAILRRVRAWIPRVEEVDLTVARQLATREMERDDGPELETPSQVDFATAMWILTDFSDFGSWMGMDADEHHGPESFPYAACRIEGAIRKRYPDLFNHVWGDTFLPATKTIAEELYGY